MKNNFRNKKYIEFDDVYNFLCEFAWLTQVHYVFLQYEVNSELSFSICLFKIIPISFVSQPKLTQVDQIFFHLSIRSKYHSIHD